MIFVILGMHKSGTTLVSRMMHESGISMGSFGEGDDYDRGNFFERHETLELNRQLLSDQDLESFDSWHVLGPEAADPLLTDAMKDLVTRLDAQNECWGFKDPRTCITYRVWRQVLPNHRLVLVFRHPAEVARHYVRRVPRWRMLRRLSRARRVLRAWFVYNDQSRQHLLAGESPAICLSYANLMKSDDTIRQVAEFVGRDLHDCRNPSMYRATETNGWEYQLGRLWCRLVDGMDVQRLHSDLMSMESEMSGGRETSTLKHGEPVNAE